MRFLIESHFSVTPTPEVLALVPAETARGQELDADHIRVHLFVAADGSEAWQIFEVDSREQLNTILSSLPLHPYVVERVVQLGGSPT